MAIALAAQLLCFLCCLVTGLTGHLVDLAFHLFLRKKSRTLVLLVQLGDGFHVDFFLAHLSGHARHLADEEDLGMTWAALARFSTLSRLPTSTNC